MSNEDRFIDSNFEQWLNILLILITLLVLNEHKSNDFIEEQKWNIQLILILLAILIKTNKVNNFISIKFRKVYRFYVGTIIEHIAHISLTWLESNLEKSIDFIDFKHVHL